MTQLSWRARMLLTHMDVITSAVLSGSPVADRYLKAGAVRLEGTNVIFDKDKYLEAVSASMAEVEREILNG